MDKSKFEGRYNNVRTTIEKYSDFSVEQKNRLEALLLTFPFEGTIKEFNSRSTTSNLPVVSSTKFVINKLKKWDVLYMHHGAVLVPHYHIVLKVVKDKVYCLTITSEKKPFADLAITKSRQLKGYICNTFTILSLGDAKKNFVFVYEGSKKEITNIFNTVKDQINSI